MLCISKTKINYYKDHKNTVKVNIYNLPMNTHIKKMLLNNKLIQINDKK